MPNGRLRSPMWWFGGKGKMVKKLLPLIPQHKIYVEVFGGGASILFAKEPSPVEVYNDLNSDLVNFFRVLRDPQKFAEFHRLVSLTPYSREEYNFCRKTWESCEDDVERAYRWFVVARMSFSGHFSNSWSFVVTKSSRGMAAGVSGWLSSIDMLPEIHGRMMRVQIDDDDFRMIIPRYDTPDTCFYMDPSYVPETRKSQDVYKYEMTLQDHQDLVAMLLDVKGAVILSGYRHDVYTPLELAGWTRHDFPTACWAAGDTRYTGIQGKGAALEMVPRIESVWLNQLATDSGIADTGMLTTGMRLL